MQNCEFNMIDKKHRLHRFIRRLQSPSKTVVTVVIHNMAYTGNYLKSSKLSHFSFHYGGGMMVNYITHMKPNNKIKF